MDYYGLFGLLPSADSETVIAVYRRLVRKYGSPGGSEPDEAIFRLLNDGLEILTSPGKRRQYDAVHGAQGGAGPNEPAGRSSRSSGSAQPGPDEAHRRDAGSKEADRESSRESANSQAERDDRESQGAAATAAGSTTDAQMPPAPIAGSSSSSATSAGTQRTVAEADDAQRTSDSRKWDPQGSYPVRVDPNILATNALQSFGLRINEFERTMLTSFRPRNREHYFIEVSLFPVDGGPKTATQFVVALYDLGFRPLDVIELLNLESGYHRDLQRFAALVGLETWMWTGPTTRDIGYEWIDRPLVGAIYHTEMLSLGLHVRHAHDFTDVGSRYDRKRTRIPATRLP